MYVLKHILKQSQIVMLQEAMKTKGAEIASKFTQLQLNKQIEGRLK